MNNVKKDLLREIDERIARKKALQLEMASRKDDVAKFALELLDEMETMIASTTVNPSLIAELAPLHVMSFQERLRVLDSGVKVHMTWMTPEDAESPSLQRISGILIKWSPAYQAANKCDPELYVDIAELLFKD